MPSSGQKSLRRLVRRTERAPEPHLDVVGVAGQRERGAVARGRGRPGRPALRGVMVARGRGCAFGPCACVRAGRATPAASAAAAEARRPRPVPDGAGHGHVVQLAARRAAQRSSRPPRLMSPRPTKSDGKSRRAPNDLQ